MNLNGLSIAFLLISTIALIGAPRRWAVLPLLIGTCYMTLEQGIMLGSLSFPIVRMLIAIGFVRVVFRGERLSGGVNGLDKLMIIWSLWALASSYFHEKSLDALIFRLGLVYNTCGIYFLIRIFCSSLNDVVQLWFLIAILLVPLAIEMFFEKTFQHNFFSIFGGVSEFPAIREGKLRAQGPFAHSILAGTVGAVCLPLMIGLWQKKRKEAVVGIVACTIIVFTSASSGPIMSAVAGIGALFMWHWRHRMRLVRWAAVMGYVLLDLVMLVPPYYLLGRVDLVGGSGGWHRAELIDSAIKHLHEWWFAGTDYTRHWMPTGVSWSPDHTDITNYYLHLGVIGGLPLITMFIAILIKGFSFVGKVLRQKNGLSMDQQFIFWTLGVSLFTHAATGISVSYFDQSFVFLYMTLAVIGSAYSGIATKTTPDN